MPALAYSFLRYKASAQSAAGITQNIRNSSNASALTSPVTAAQPNTGGMAPEAAADDDILRGARLQDHGVNHGIADEGAEREPHGERVDPGVEAASSPIPPTMPANNRVAAKSLHRAAGRARCAP